MTEYDLIVVGGGSGGFGAALAAARLACRVLLLERSPILGGNATHGGVNCWEPGVGGTGIPFDLYKRLKRIPHAVGIYSFGRHIAWQSTAQTPRFPGGELLIDPSKGYLDTLRRFGAPPDFQEEHFRRTYWHGVPFDPDLYAREMELMLLETGCCEIRKGVAYTQCQTEGRKITALQLNTGETVASRYFVDATAEIHLAREAGCAVTHGQEARHCYGEPGAPVEAGEALNGTSLIYRISRRATPSIDPLPDDIPAHCWWQRHFPLVACTQYPNGDFNMNTLPTMEGREARSLPYPVAYRECRRRILAHWHYLQTTFEEFQYYRIIWIAPTLGIREGPRLSGRYVLTEHDLDHGISRQSHDDIIALSDHAKDTHGESTGRSRAMEMREPYGIPFRSLLPREIDNLLVACRGASFSSIAASSCRLSRTMMQMGQAAGTAVALALQQPISSLGDLPPASLREALSAQNVELSWPRPDSLTDYLKAE